VQQQRGVQQTTTVIEEIFSGAGSFLSNIGRNLVSPQAARNVKQRSENGGGRKFVQVNRNYKNMTGNIRKPPLLNEVPRPLMIVSQSDSSDLDVDISITSYESSQSTHNRKSILS